jgi:hypothetical protein
LCDDDFILCDEFAVIEAFGNQHDPTEWCLFFGSSKVSLKAELLQNENKFPSIPLAHAAKMKESYENMKPLLEKSQYEKYNCNICGDL